MAIDASIGHARKLLSQAVAGALLQDGSFQRRLVHGLSGGVGRLYTMDRHCLPPQLRRKFDALWKACTRKADASGQRTPVDVTVSNMTNAQARKWLGELFTLYVRAAENLY